MYSQQLKYVLVLLLINAALCQNIKEEKSFTTAIANMERLLRTEIQLIAELENFANELQTKLSIIRSGAAMMRRENLKSKSDPEKYLSNPLNAFSLMRRMQADWISWELFMSKSVGEANIKAVQQLRENVPDAKDLSEAISAIYRLQRTYDLKASEMAAGYLHGNQYEAKLSSLDCYTIGVGLFDREMYYDAGFWLYIALESYDQNDLFTAIEFNKVKILEMYAETMLKHNRPEDALLVLDKAIDLSPRSATLLSKKIDIKAKIRVDKSPPKVYSIKEPSDYERGCRGEYDDKMPQMYCTFNTTTTPFLRIAPLKMEIVQLDPYMVIYHDVISDKEIAILKHMAIPQLKRATVYSENSSKSVVVDRRTSQFAWFYDKTNDVTIRLNERITDMTGFNLVGSEMLQVMNYGLGGHYDTHYDFFNVSADTEIIRTTGNRIATVLFYLSDVEQGGATVFPNIETSVLPRKGMAVMWYNLNNRGDGNWLTLHAACPVIVGSKWVCNKWIRERNQLFTKPCARE
ncbi:prolyl 4-hydroxylase subunit alpha-1-like isoform X1 [Teleopsis dalmanni]|uniref:prolyl 4-hydroxylase subunit alpha-1-like isoform X1 n=1 Tax=Teleopsis dalmanni TaxID=139649 RepID=UPI0018CD1674|nr:prolyl 4-hydroxylase subunit alpha-1-like isoform X1 [Teleopsis dalmanni]